MSKETFELVYSTFFILVLAVVFIGLIFNGEGPRRSYCKRNLRKDGPVCHPVRVLHDFEPIKPPSDEQLYTDAMRNIPQDALDRADKALAAIDADVFDRKAKELIAAILRESEQVPSANGGWIQIIFPANVKSVAREFGVTIDHPTGPCASK